ncbi:TonB C-terminal domain-containing protein [Sulfurospirillum oryzae]|uniref:TonB C-terminal domain-containing protein n=1 Tax=Sulfurospirillum oryzae TaxID=2976535 RepID=UPI0021E83106|nr:TonB C-terminal domain-containing protein [Sulfurospirillum oryzae]
MSILLYVVLLVFFAYIIGHQKDTIKNYTSQKDPMNVALVERKKNDSEKLKEERKKEEVQKPVEKPAEKPPAEEKKVASSPKEAVKSQSLRGLFEDINTSKLPPDAKEQKKDQTAPTRIKPNKEETKEKSENAASKIANSLNFSEQKHSIDSKKGGEYDPFIGKVQEILEENWQKTIDTENGNVAKVVIKVSDRGTFSYKIVSLSYNNEFNTKLKEFLKAMESVEFPKYEKGPLFEMQVEFKDIKE